MAEQVKKVIALLEDTDVLLQKTQINLKKCPKVRLTKSYLQTRYTTVEEYWNTFKNAHRDLIAQVTAEQKSSLPYFTEDTYFQCEELYFTLQAELKDMLDTFEQSTSHTVDHSKSTNTRGTENVDMLVKLPRIQLPTFSGNYEEWPAFQDMYVALIHSNISLSKVQKLHYLKTSLTGEAEGLLRHIQVTEDNYESSWKMLKARYGNKRILVNSLLKRLFFQRKILVQTSQNIKSLLDTTTECINGLKNQQLSTESWDPLIIFLVVQKLDPETHKDWEEYAYKENSEDLPTWDELCKFLESKFRTLQLVTNTKERLTKPKEYAVNVATSVDQPRNCAICKEYHTLCHCSEFIKMTPEERSDYIKNNNLCFNCLASGHTARRCRLSMSCRICNKRHHTMVHETAPKPPENVQSHHSRVEDNDQEPTDDGEDLVSTHLATTTSTALLATAIVPVMNIDGHTTLLRTLIDIGSQASFISERAAQSLRLKRIPINGTITGVGSTKSQVKHASEVQILSRNDDQFKITTKVYVMPTQLTTLLPSKTIQTNAWPHLEGLVLADPSYHQPGRIDMLLGVDVCAQIMKNEVIKGPIGTPCAQNTSFGWILFGAIQNDDQRHEFTALHLSVDIHEMLKQMWEQPQDDKKKYTAQERKCEALFNETTTRTEEGRYIVKLPKKSDPLLSTQGETRKIALKRLYQLEKRLEKNNKLKIEYSKVMQEYIDLHHMQLVPKNEISKPAVYLPHHAVVKEEKETSKVRIVFNASQKGVNNVSLNDELLVGPQLQEDIRNLIMRWRMKKICFVADVQKMYRQIFVCKEDQDLQRVLWRNHPNEEVQDFKMMRVTFGTASAPYLAVQTLHQVAEDEGQDNPEAKRIIKEDCFMDDCMSGSDSIHEAIKNAKNVQKILAKGGFVLQKWCSNSLEFLKEFSPEERSNHVNLNITLDGIIRALGLHWNMGADVFEYSLSLPKVNSHLTKRTILSEIQKLFDPLGWLAPSVLQAKLLIQSLWLQGKTWDEEVDEQTAKRWMDLKEDFKNFSKIKIKRWLNTRERDMNKVTVHGFCDASNRAYAAVAYVRVRNESGQIETSIIGAKTRVASIKPPSIPRLELLGALLLAGLLKQIKEAMRIPTNRIVAWTDSTIVLAWLGGDPTRWKTFVRNKVIEIIDNIPNQNWYHVQSADNPADLASRGKTLLELSQEKIWWNGPDWLINDEIHYHRPQHCTTNLEQRENIQVHLKINNEENQQWLKFEEFNNLTELLKTIVYCKRFLKGKKLEDKDSSITTLELDDALQRCILVAQKHFDEDIQRLKQKKQVTQDSKIKSLNPYLDQNEVLRVGGRLRHSDLPENEKHPIVLDPDNYLSELIVADAHLRTMHGGIQLMLGYLRAKFWILKVKRLVKAKIRKCLICAKHSAVARSQLMGDLPRVRVTPSRAFLHSGVDFAGPYSILNSKGRGAKTSKAYIALFVCMSTKAIHLELVGDLTSESFIGSFRRFISRRGRCTDIWSDQGRNFVGADKEMQLAMAEAKFDFQGEVTETLALDGTQWHFIPAHSPHMGGLWEAGVKSMKHHLKRVLSSNLTYEEMSTLLCQIEACLNSRPLSPIEPQDIDANQLQPLTPGHFLVGEAPITIPTPNLLIKKTSHLSRWQHMQKLLQDFWSRWQQEYLSRLQQRPKWLKRVPEFKIGDIVLIKIDNLPPGKWLMGRIQDKHPGADGVTRVYSVKNGQNVIKRPSNKLCYLPIDLE